MTIEGKQGSRPATLADVAARAGVSTSTASLAFRSAGSITDRTRARILRAAQELGYAGPHPAARALKRGRSGIVGIVVAEEVRFAFHNPTTIATMDGLSEVLDELGYGQLLLPGHTGSGSSAAPFKIANLPVDGVVFATRGEESDRLLPMLRGRGVPMVGIEGPHADDIALVEIDDYAAMVQLVSHVASLGHRRVAVLMRTTEPSRQRPPQAPVDIRTAMGRAGNQTIANRLRAVGDRWPDAVVVESGGRLSDAGEAAARVLLQLADRPSAILAQNDQLAFGALRAAAAMGVSVPHELTVTGFDGIELPGVAIELTTVAQPLRERGALAGRLIDGLIEGSPITTHVLPTTLIVGATSGPAPALRTPGPASSERARTPTTQSRHEHPEALGRP